MPWGTSAGLEIVLNSSAWTGRCGHKLTSLRCTRAVLFSGTRLATYATYYPAFKIKPCNIQDHWDSLKGVGFDHVDTVFPSSDGNLWYFFCASRFARLKLSRGHEFDGNRSRSTLESGDWSISGSFTSFRNWPLWGRLLISVNTSACIWPLWDVV